MLKVFYGAHHFYVDVTSIALAHCLVNVESNSRVIKMLKIPRGDTVRFKLFGVDPAYGHVKEVKVQHGSIVECFYQHEEVLLGLHHEPVEQLPASLENEDKKETSTATDLVDKKNSHSLSDLLLSKAYIVCPADLRVALLHSHIQGFTKEWLQDVEFQGLCMNVLRPGNVVWEIGGGSGRIPIVCAAALYPKITGYLLVNEVNPAKAKAIAMLGFQNHIDFDIETCAVSDKPLILRGSQLVDPESENDDDDAAGGEKSMPVTVVSSLQNLETKWNNRRFDTIVCHSRGSFYDILMMDSETNVLSNINTLILKNDFDMLYKKFYVDQLLQTQNFVQVHNISHGNGICAPNYFEVWKRLDV